MDEAYEIIPISSRCWRIEDGGVRCFLFAGKTKALLIDTGFGGGKLRQAVEGLTDLPVMLINTHADRDHVGCNALFDCAWMHPAEYAHYAEKDGAGLPVRPLWEGDVIDLGYWRFEIVLIPGHTPGSIALFDRENRLLIAGDTVADAPIYMFGPARNLPAYIESLDKLLALSAGFDTIYSSHGSFPLPGDFLPRLRESAQMLLAGALTAAPAPAHIPAQLYKAKAGAFYY